MIICSNGVDTETLPFEYSTDGRTVVFIGKNTTQANVDAITHFPRVVLRAVKERLRDVCFRVVGEIGTAFAGDLRAEGIEVTG